MKTILLNRCVGFILLSLIFLNNINCSKESDDNFCHESRTASAGVDDRQGTVIFYSKYNRYAISLYVPPPNIDTQIIGFVCDLPSDLKTVGLEVIASGTLKAFNSNENIEPTLGGEELYFFETTKIVKKP